MWIILMLADDTYPAFPWESENCWYLWAYEKELKIKLAFRRGCECLSCAPRAAGMCWTGSVWSQWGRISEALSFLFDLAGHEEWRAQPRAAQSGQCQEHLSSHRGLPLPRQGRWILCQAGKGASNGALSLCSEGEGKDLFVLLPGWAPWRTGI